MSCGCLYLIGELRPGGAERQLYFLLKGMDRERYQPHVVVWNFCEDDPYALQIRALGVPLHSLPRTLSAATKLTQFRSLVGELKPKVVHSYSFYLNFAAHWAVQGMPAIAVGSVRGDFAIEKKDAGPWLGRLSGRWPRHQISNNFSAAAILCHSQSPFVPSQLSVIRNGLDLEYFRRSPVGSGGPACILGVGSLLPVKRWDRLITAALELKQRGFHFLVQIAGDGPLRKPLLQLVHNLGLAGCVEFMGHVDNVPSLLSKATFLVHPSDTEGCPNVVMEAMACGRAVVATDVGDVPELIQNGVTGFVVPLQDDTTLTNRMAQLITDRELCRHMGEAGRAKAESEFGLNRLISETLAAYRFPGREDAAIPLRR